MNLVVQIINLTNNEIRCHIIKARNENENVFSFVIEDSMNSRIVNKSMKNM